MGYTLRHVGDVQRDKSLIALSKHTHLNVNGPSKNELV